MNSELTGFLFGVVVVALDNSLIRRKSVFDCEDEFRSLFVELSVITPHQAIAIFINLDSQGFAAWAIPR